MTRGCLLQVVARVAVEVLVVLLDPGDVLGRAFLDLAEPGSSRLMRTRLGGSSSPTVPQELNQEKKPMTPTPSV